MSSMETPDFCPPVELCSTVRVRFTAVHGDCVISIQRSLNAITAQQLTRELDVICPQDFAATFVSLVNVVSVQFY